MNAQTLHAKPTFKQFHLFADCKAALARYAYCRTHPNPIAVSLLALASAKNLKRQCAQLRAYIRELDQSPNAISLPKAIKFQQELQELLHGFYPLRKPKKAITVATLPHILDEITTEYTALPSFSALIDASHNYRPTLYCYAATDEGDRACLTFLADHYDQAQTQRGDPRRAYRT